MIRRADIDVFNTMRVFNTRLDRTQHSTVTNYEECSQTVLTFRSEVFCLGLLRFKLQLLTVKRTGVSEINACSGVECASQIHFMSVLNLYRRRGD